MRRGERAGFVDTRRKISVQSTVTDRSAAEGTGGARAAAAAADPALSIVIPAYNEGRRLGRTLEAARAYLRHTRPDLAAEILVVDDGSRDDTAALAQAWAAQNDDAAVVTRVLRYETNRGKGHAVRYGVLRAAGARVLFMDADLATPMEELTKLEAALNAAGTAGVAIGSRPLRESRLLVRQPWWREAAGRGFNQAVQLFATPGLHDTQCGFKLFTRAAARDVFSRCVLDGFGFDIEALFVARRLGYVVAEVPVAWAHQEGSTAFPSKWAWIKSGARMLADIVRIRWVHRAVSPRAVAAAAAGASAPAHPSA